ncbi:MAG: DUF922 domain-containing protein [Armatimonadetes bacterium]|nr:DUF922 domain-containing protein [Armatimonadota bacterium]MBS1727436.1 DUF922 domain-containing protein [Armatimonadota bacterium]
MRFPATFRYATATLLTAALLVTVYGAGLRLHRFDTQKALGTQSADFYRQGRKYVADNYDSPAWKARMVFGKLPYHRLTGNDFRVDDQVASNDGVFTDGFINLDYRCRFVTIDRNHTTAILTEAHVASGFDTKTSWRRSGFTNPSVYLQHEQGHQDINELAARTLAGLIAQNKPEGAGVTKDDALRDLESKLRELYRQVSDQDHREQAEYDSQTNSGKDTKAQAVVTADMAKKLANAGIAATWQSSDAGGEASVVQ